MDPNTYSKDIWKARVLKTVLVGEVGVETLVESSKLGPSAKGMPTIEFLEKQQGQQTFSRP